MSRPARARISAPALRHNLALVRSHAPHAKVMAVVKANAYGHGLTRVTKALEDADAFGVASVEEGIQLRNETGLDRPVCLLEGFFDAAELPLLINYRLSPVIHQQRQIHALQTYPGAGAIDIWLKIDTGMNRLGFTPEVVDQVLSQLQQCSLVKDIKLMSHLADADFPDSAATRTQIQRFRDVAAKYGLPASLANSAGIMGWPDSHFQWVRPGIMLYGGSPLEGKTAEALQLQAVMTVESALIAVTRGNKGDAIGYGGTWICPEDMPVGVAAFGYGDGYPRHAPNGTPVLVNGKRVPLIGRVSMDMITVDLRAQPNAKISDPVVLWGEGLPVDEIARQAGTISYELVCHVTERIPRVPTAEEQVA